MYLAISNVDGFIMTACGENVKADLGNLKRQLRNAGYVEFHERVFDYFTDIGKMDLLRDLLIKHKQPMSIGLIQNAKYYRTRPEFTNDADKIRLLDFLEEHAAGVMAMPRVKKDWCMMKGCTIYRINTQTLQLEPLK